jgi:hypothetical protein
MSTPTNPRLEVCPDMPQTLRDLACIADEGNYLGNFNEVPAGSSFRIVVETEVGGDLDVSMMSDNVANGDVNPNEQYFVLRRTGEGEDRWYPWRIQAKDAIAGKPVIPYGAVTEDGRTIDVGSVVKGMGFLLAEIDLHPHDLPAPEGKIVVADGVLATRLINLGVVKRTIGLIQEGPKANGAAEN